MRAEPLKVTMAILWFGRRFGIDKTGGSLADLDLIPRLHAGLIEKQDERAGLRRGGCGFQRRNL